LKPSRKKMSIKRKWKTVPMYGPRSPASSRFIIHEEAREREFQASQQSNENSPPQAILADRPIPPRGFQIDEKNMFAVIKSSHRLQHKVTVGDIIQTEKMHRREAGDKLIFGTVLLVGGKDFTIIGKPTVEYCKVHCTVEQQTLTKEVVSFYYKPRRRMSRFLRVRHWVTMLHIDKIELDLDQAVSDLTKKPLPTESTMKPKALLDLWANRWLSLQEKQSLVNKKLPEDLHDGTEHQPGSYQRRGLCQSYRFNPDPLAPIVKHF
jgi:large subunit ribosomal protein L21